MKTVILYVVDKKSNESKWIKLPVNEEKDLLSLLPDSKRYLIHKFKTSLPNLKLNMSEDIVSLNRIVLSFSNYSDVQKKKVLALCENGLEFQKAVLESNTYELVEDVKDISDYGLYVAEKEVKLSKRMLTNINMKSYGESIIKLDKEVLFSSYGLLRKEK